MKQMILMLTVCTFFAGSAHADFVFYGKGNVSLQQADEQQRGDRMELVSNASRIGLKGSEKINDKLKAIYQFEYQTEVDDGVNPSGTFSQRNIFIGVEGNFGRLTAGLFDTPLKLVQEKIDLFNDLAGDIGQLLNGEIRAKNIVQYSTPASLGKLGLSVAYITQEDADLDDGVSASLGYARGSLYVGLAVDQDVVPGVETRRLAAAYTLASVRLGALYEYSDKEGVDEEGFIVSALWNPRPAWGLKAQYGESDIKAPQSRSTSVGADYYLTKKVTLFSYVTQVKNQTNRDDQYVGLGLDVKF